MAASLPGEVADLKLERKDSETSCSSKSSSERGQVNEDSSKLDVQVTSQTLKWRKNFSFCHIPINYLMRSRVKREKQTYYMFVEQEGKERVLILAARKRKKCLNVQFLISVDPSKQKRQSLGVIAKLKSDTIRTEFTLHECSRNPFESNELVGIVFNYGALGTRMEGTQALSTCIIPGMNDWDYGRVSLDDDENDGLISMWKKRNTSHLVQLQLKRPVWDKKSKFPSLNFNKRVARPSTYNFQLIHPHAEEYIVLQFGRINDDEFILDFRYPLCPLQAFGIALSSLGKKLGAVKP